VLNIARTFAQPPPPCSSSDFVNVTVDTFDSGNRNDVAYAMAFIDDEDEDKDKDDGIVIVGTTDFESSPKTEGFIVIIDENGDDYRAVRGGNGNDAFNSVIQASDGRIIVCGWKKSNAKGGMQSANVWVVEYGLTANFIEEHEYGGSGTDQGWNILEDGDNDAFVIVGRAGDADPPDGDLDVHNSINGQSQYWVFRIDYDTYAITAFNRIYRGNFTGIVSEDWATQVIIDSDGNYMISGYCASCDPNEVQWDALLLNLDPSNGSINWGGIYGYNPSTGSRDQGAFEIMEVREFGTDYFVAAGNHHPTATGSCFGDDLHDAWVLKINDSGVDIWSPGCELSEGQDYGGTYTDDAYAIVETCDEEYLFAGKTKSPGGNYDVTCKNGGSTSDAWLVKLNRNGTIDWDASLGGSFDDALHSIEQNEDGSYAAVGEYGGGPNGKFQNFYVIRFEINECTRLENIDSSSEPKISIYPNPAEHFLEVTLSLSSSHDQTAVIEILDQSGRVLLSAQGSIEGGVLIYQFTKFNYPSGFYHLRIRAGEELYYSKLTIQ
jgi:hypothetical protein